MLHASSLFATTQSHRCSSSRCTSARNLVADLRLHACGIAAVTPSHQCGGPGVLPCSPAEEEEGRTCCGSMMWWRGNWYEADGRLFREALAPLYLIPIMAAAALPLRSAALPAVLAATGIRELPAQANQQAVSRWDRKTLQGPRGWFFLARVNWRGV